MTYQFLFLHPAETLTRWLYCLNATYNSEDTDLLNPIRAFLKPCFLQTRPSEASRIVDHQEGFYPTLQVPMFVVSTRKRQEST